MVVVFHGVVGEAVGSVIRAVICGTVGMRLALVLGIVIWNYGFRYFGKGKHSRCSIGSKSFGSNM